MDRRTVYIPEVIHTLVQSPNLHTCACTHGRCDYKDIGNCQEYALVNPADLAKEAEDARIGRAVREYIDGQKKHGYYQSRSTPYQQGVADAIEAVDKVIAKAREVTA